MTKYEFKRFPIVATVLTILGLLAAVLAISISLMSSKYYDGTVSLALLEIAATVLILAGLTTGKVVLLRVISTIITVGVLTSALIIAMFKYGYKDVYLFSVALLMFICSLLSLIYFTVIRNKRIENLYFVSSGVLTSLAVVYLIIYVVKDIVNNGNELSPHIYALLCSYAFITILPMMVYCSLTKVEVEPANNTAQEPQEDFNKEEEQEEQPKEEIPVDQQ